MKKTLVFAADSRIMSLDSACLANAIPSRAVRTSVIPQTPTEETSVYLSTILFFVQLQQQ